MYYYHDRGRLAASPLPDLPLPPAEAGLPALFLTSGDPTRGRTVWRPTAHHHLTTPASVAWLDRNTEEAAELPEPVLSALNDGTLTAVNVRHPRWEAALERLTPKTGKKRVHLLAVGDVGGTLLTALKLLGGDCISTIGICDLNEKAVERWTAEMGQIAWPWDYGALPEVEPVTADRLFACDVFLFAATKSIPPVGSTVTDVRMAQFAANRPLVESFARQARDAHFQGLFIVLSDPVDPLCRAAFLASNTGPNGQWDGNGLFAEQVQGFGLGVMNARAAYFAKQDPRFAAFLTEGRSFGPHGHGLVIANSVEHYDDELSQELTHQVETANLRIRDLGFKPYVAPAVSSGAMQLLLTLRGQWRCASMCLGDVWFGARSRLTEWGGEMECLPQPPALRARLEETETLLKAIV